MGNWVKKAQLPKKPFPMMQLLIIMAGCSHNQSHIIIKNIKPNPKTCALQNNPRNLC